MNWAGGYCIQFHGGIAALARTEAKRTVSRLRVGYVRDAGYRHWGFSGVASFPPDKCPDSRGRICNAVHIL